MQWNQFSGSCPRTKIAGSLPVLFTRKITLPEGPASALARSNRIDRTSPCLRIQKYAITIRTFLQAIAYPDSSRVGVYNRFDRFSYVFSNCFEFALVDPNKPRRSGTAFSTRCTFKTQPILIPRGRFHLLIHLSLERYSQDLNGDNQLSTL